MHHIETYTEQYYLDVVEIINNFYLESLKEYDCGIDKDMLKDTITNVAKGNTFLLVIDGKCQGVFAGIEVKGFLNKKRVFQEIIWYVNKSFRRYGVSLYRSAEVALKGFGFDTIIMAVMENSKSKKIKSFYERLGFQLFESQYIRAL